MVSERELELSRELSAMSERISNVVESFVRHVEVDAGETELLRTLSGQVAELAENVGSLSSSLSVIRSRLEHVLLAKVAVDSMRCLECGQEYGAEPGPQLCGPCWVGLGRPRVWKGSPGVGLYLVEPATGTNLYRWHAARPDCRGLFTYDGPRPCACPGCGQNGAHDAC